MRSTKSRGLTLAAAWIIGVVGCAEKSGIHEETKVSTPEGTKTITRDTKVETTGQKPPSTVDPGTAKP